MLGSGNFGDASLCHITEVVAMPRKQEWEREIESARRVETWSLAAPNRLVKAVALERPVIARVNGFVTLERSLLGRTPRQLEDDLGLPAGSFARGCRIYRLTRLPSSQEIEYELTAEHPDGLAFDEWRALDEVLRRRLDPSHTHRPIYGPGRKSIHQWRLTTELPVTIVTDLLPGMAYPYPNR